MGAALKASRSDVVRVGYFGSYARGDCGVGSDLDLVVVLTMQRAAATARTRLRHHRGFPVPVDLLVYTRVSRCRLRLRDAIRAAPARGGGVR